MCRYAFKNYKPRFACFACRQSFRLPKVEEMAHTPELDEQGLHVAPCPSCGARMMDVGMDFKVPKREDIRAWKAVEILLRAGIRYQGCGCDAGGWKPQTPASAISYVERLSKSRLKWAATAKEIERVEIK